MKYLSVSEAAKEWSVSERSVRNYCAQGRVPGAFLTGKTWNIPEDAHKPPRINEGKKHSSKHNPLLARLREEKHSKIAGGIYHKVQIELTYNSNHIEGSKLSIEQTRLIFETATIGMGDATVNVDDIIETANHFRAIDYIIDNVEKRITQRMIKELHRILKTGTNDESKDWFRVGEYKLLPNEVGGRQTCSPELVQKEIKNLLDEYDSHGAHDLESIIAFHVAFERIHPFQDGNGRVGRLLMFKELLANDIVPFIIEDENKAFYYRGLSEWDSEQGYLRDTCLFAQDRFKMSLDYFRIPYSD